MLEIKSLSVSYGKVKALTDVSLKVEKGQLYTVIGSNGAGKTTLLKTISGVLKPDHGEIVFNGEVISKLEGHQIARKKISHVPEGRQLFSEMTVQENIEMGGLQLDKKTLNEKIEWVYDLFPILEERKHKQAHTLSGGQQQMLAIARGIISDPEILLLDEPTLGLAPIIVNELKEIILNLNKAGITIILVEQNANMALSIATHGCVIENGSLVVEKEVEKLREDSIVKNAYLGLN